MKSPITTHVLDTSAGHPAEGVPVLLEISQGGDQWKTLGVGATNEDGRLGNLLRETHLLMPGIYRLTFDTRAYFEAQGVENTFYPLVPVIFEVKDPAQHYHVPLLLNPFGYGTYRGS